MIRDIPKISNYRETYDKAMSGKSRKAGIRAFCLECCAWEREEVHFCTDKFCPLFPYRPFKRDKLSVKQAVEGSKVCNKVRFQTAESTKVKKEAL